MSKEAPPKASVGWERREVPAHVEYFMQLNPRNVGRAGGFAVTCGEGRPNWFHRAMLRLLLGWTVTEGPNG